MTILRWLDMQKFYKIIEGSIFNPRTHDNIVIVGRWSAVKLHDDFLEKCCSFLFYFTPQCWNLVSIVYSYPILKPGIAWLLKTRAEIEAEWDVFDRIVLLYICVFRLSSQTSGPTMQFSQFLQVKEISLAVVAVVFSNFWDM